MRINNPIHIGIINRNRHFDGGRGTAANPYRIVKIRHLDAMRRYAAAHYRLENDIVFDDEFEEDGEYWNDGFCWNPAENVMTGDFDGNNKKIVNLKSFARENSTGALMKRLTGGMKDVHFVNLHMDGRGYDDVNRSTIGGVLGRCGTKNIERVIVEGYLRCPNIGGGIVGEVNGTKFYNSIVDMTIAGSNRTGGFCGQTAWGVDLYDCYSKGALSSGWRRAGITGTTSGSRIHRCFSSMVLTGGNAHLRSGLMSSFDAGYVTACVSMQTNNGYWDMDVMNVSFNYGGDCADGHGLTTLQAKYPYELHPDHGEPYKNWDFDQVWAHDIDGTINDGYPYLRGVTPGGLLPGEPYFP